MKRTALLSFICCLMMSLYGKAQVVTLSVKNARLESVLKEFKKQTGYSFFYNEALLSKAERVTISLKDAPLPVALGTCFKNQPALDFSIDGQIVTITEKAVPPTRMNPGNGVPAVMQALPGISVKGVVVGKNYQALSNASIVVKGKNRGASTMADGSFHLDKLEPSDILVASFIGFKSAEMIVGDKQTVNFVLEESTDQLDEVVATAYSNTTRRFSTTSINKVNGAEIGSRPVTNPLLALQGRVPGVTVTPYTGYDAGPLNIEIRGRGLMSQAGGSPLYVIDGNPLPPGNSALGAAGDGPVKGIFGMYSPAVGQSVLYGVNPKDIESIEILKDVGATAVYGSLGANGVILITTKKGKAGKATVDVGMSVGFKKVTRYWDMLSTPQYLQMRREALKNDGIVPTPQSAPDLTVWDTTRYTDWQKEFWGKTGKVVNAHVNISGGTNQFTHKISGNFSKADDITSFKGKNNTADVSILLNHSSNDQKFRVGLSGKYLHTFNSMIRTMNVVKLPPNAPPLFTETGLLNYEPWNDIGMPLFMQQFENMVRPTESTVNSIFSSLTLSYQLATGLSFTTQVGFSSSNTQGIMLSPSTSFNPRDNPTGMTVSGASNSSSWNVQPLITYETTLFGKGRLQGQVGAHLQHSETSNTDITAIGYTNDALLRSLNMATFSQSFNNYFPYKYGGVFGRLMYRWDNRYVFEANARRDGSSKFGPGNRFGNFGSVGFAWVASEEPWLKKVIAPVVTNLKFYGNTGTSGNDGGKDYQYISQWGKPFGMLDYDNTLSLVNLHAVNQEYHWQLQKELNLGMNIDLFAKNRLSISIAYYRRRLGDQLNSNPTPVYTGFKDVYGNWDATVQNSGWEFSAGLDIIRTRDFSWGVSVNAALNKNILYSYPGIEYSSFYAFELIGRSRGTQYLLDYLGVDPMTGNYQFRDYNKNGKIEMRQYSGPPLDGSNDMMYTLDVYPWISGGMSHNFSYKNWRLNLNFDYAGQKGRNAIADMSGAGTMENIAREVFENHWQKPGDITKYAKFSTNPSANATSNSNLGYTDASFLRLNYISVDYTLESKWIRRLGLSNTSFSIQTSRIFTFTRYKGLDPEMQSFGNMPPARTINASINLTF